MAKSLSKLRGSALKGNIFSNQIFDSFQLFWDFKFQFDLRNFNILKNKICLDEYNLKSRF